MLRIEFLGQCAKSFAALFIRTELIERSARRTQQHRAAGGRDFARGLNRLRQRVRVNHFCGGQAVAKRSIGDEFAGLADGD